MAAPGTVGAKAGSGDDRRAAGADRTDPTTVARGQFALPSVIAASCVLVAVVILALLGVAAVSDWAADRGKRVVALPAAHPCPKGDYPMGGAKLGARTEATRAVRPSTGVAGNDVENAGRGSGIWKRFVLPISENRLAATLVAAALIGLSRLIRAMALRKHGVAGRSIPETTIMNIYDTVGEDAPLAEQELRARTLFADRTVHDIHATVLDHPEQLTGSRQWMLRLREDTGATFVFRTSNGCSELRKNAEVVVSGRIVVKCDDNVTIELHDGTVGFRRTRSGIAAMFSWLW